MAQEDREPVQQSVHVDCPIEEAFELFTERLGDWWPTRDGDSGQRELGNVTIWDPPRRVSFTWKSLEEETVDVMFSPDGDGTRVTLTHYGWQNASVEITSMAASFGEFAMQQLMVLA